MRFRLDWEGFANCCCVHLSCWRYSLLGRYQWCWIVGASFRCTNFLIGSSCPWNQPTSLEVTALKMEAEDCSSPELLLPPQYPCSLNKGFQLLLNFEFLRSKSSPYEYPLMCDDFDSASYQLRFVRCHSLTWYFRCLFDCRRHSWCEAFPLHAQ